MMRMFECNRTKPFLIRYNALYLYFLLGLSLRCTSKALEPFVVDRSYVAIYILDTAIKSKILLSK